MMIKNLLEKIKKEFTIDGIVHQRYYHTIGVIEMALTLNNVHNLNISQEKLILASAFHDIAKLLDKETMWDILTKHYASELALLKDYPQIWHSFVGKIYAKEKYGIDDPEILNAIKYHTTGHKNMTELEKIIFPVSVKHISKSPSLYLIALLIRLEKIRDKAIRLAFLTILFSVIRIFGVIFCCCKTP